MNLLTVLYKEGDAYVIKEAITGVTTQGRTVDEAIANVKEAVSLYVEEAPDAREDIENSEMIGALNLEMP